MIGRRLLLLAGLLARAVPAVGQPAPPPGNGRTPLLVAGKKSLYQRVITRPGASLAPGPGPDHAQPIPGFAVYYVYRREGGDNGWLEVGSAADGRTQGWVPAAKAIDWRHAMIGAFTNPAGREPVLFMDSEDAARQLILDEHAGTTVQALRRQVAAGHPGPVAAMEPENWVDITRSFYLLPILKAEIVERADGPPVRLLEVISAPAEPPPSAARPDPLRDFKAALVFLIDTTVSMQPYIDGTRDAVKAIVARIGGTALKENFRFGVVAYRDSLEDTPALEYPTKVYAQPDFSQPPELGGAVDGRYPAGKGLLGRIRRRPDWRSQYRVYGNKLGTGERTLCGADHRCRRPSGQPRAQPDPSWHSRNPRKGARQSCDGDGDPFAHGRRRAGARP